MAMKQRCELGREDFLDLVASYGGRARPAIGVRVKQRPCLNREIDPVKLRDVDDAQASIVALAKDLAAQGEIQISQSKDDEMIV